MAACFAYILSEKTKVWAGHFQVSIAVPNWSIEGGSSVAVEFGPSVKALDQCWVRACHLCARARSQMLPPRPACCSSAPTRGDLGRGCCARR